MCGIAGIIGLEPNQVAETQRKVLEALHHRGPDASGAYSDDHILMMHTRLSILDLDERSHQPFHDPEGKFVLVFNGEIYNFKEIRSQLKEFKFKTESDTEVVLAAWKKWGEDCVKRFNGMFAIAVWNKETQELTLVRDRLGIKPVYLFQGDDVFVFSSEIRSMLATGLVKRKINKSRLSEYLKYQTVHAPETLIEDVQMLPAGHILKVSGQDVRSRVFWEFKGKPGDQNETSIKNSIKAELINAVERRLVSDVPLGAFLSGGIDSSLIVGIIRKELNKELDTFSITFNEEEFSEAPFSRLISQKFGTRHHEIQLSAEHFLHDVPKALNSMDHPSGDGPNSYVVSQAVKKEGITVALSGLGGDELFAGYPFFKQYLALQQKRYLLSYPEFFRKFLTSGMGLFRSGTRWEKIAETLVLPYFDLPHTYPINRRVLSDTHLESVLGIVGKDRLKDQLTELFEFNSGPSKMPMLSQVSVAEMSSYMQNVLLRDTDQMSMAHALEVRVPFLDHSLVELALGIPDHFKNPKYPKSLLVESFGNLLPDEIVHRPKMGFVLPWENWLRNELRPLCESSLAYLASTEYFGLQGLHALWADFDQGKISWSRVWPLIALGEWMKINRIE